MRLNKEVCKRCWLEGNEWEWRLSDEADWAKGEVWCERLPRGSVMPVSAPVPVECDTPPDGCPYAAEHLVSQCD